MSVDVQVSTGLYKKLDAKKLMNAAEKSVRETTIELEGECKDYSPVDTGNLRRSFSYDVSGGGSVTRAQVKNSTNYWVFQEYGTRYIPAQGFIQRAVEVTEPAAKITSRFSRYYKPDG